MAKRRPRNVQPTPVRIPLRWEVVRNPRTWLESGFSLALLLTPLAFHSATSNSIVVKDFFSAWFFWFFLLLGGLVLYAEKSWRRIPISFAAPFLVYFLYGTIRALTSPYPEHSWASWKLTVFAVAPLIPCFLIAGSPRAGRRAFFFLALGALATCLYAAIQFAGAILERPNLDPVRWPWNRWPLSSGLLKALETDLRAFKWEAFDGLGGLPGVCSTLGNPNFFAGFLVGLIPVIAAAAVAASRNKSRLLLGALAGLGLLSLVFAGSRGGFLGVLGALAILPATLGVVFRKDVYRAKRRLGALLSLTFSGAIVLGLGYYFFIAQSPERGKGLGDLENRSIVYRCTAELIGDRFFLGVSPGLFSVRFPAYLRGVSAEKYGWMESPEEKVLEHAHSEILEIWSDLGVVGVALYLGFLVAWVVWVYRGSKRIERKDLRIVLAGIVCGVAAVQFENLVSTDMRWTASAWTLWGLLGAGAGIVVYSNGNADREIRRQPLPAWASPVAGLAVILLFLPSAKEYVADWYFTLGRNALAQNVPDGPDYLETSIALNPSYPQAPYLLAGYYYSTGDYKKAIELYERVREIRGDVVVVAENLATAHVKLSTVLEKDFERKEALLKAIDLYEQSLQRHPTFPRLADYLSRAYKMLGLERKSEIQRKRAIRLYEMWLAWDSSYPRPQYALDLSKNYFLEQDYDKSFWLLRTAKRWEGKEEGINAMRDALFQVRPGLAELWEREEEKAREASNTVKGEE